VGITAVVLVGGFGTRLRPVTYAVPKQLIPVAGQPILFHALDILPREVTQVTLACGYKAEQFESYLEAHPYRIPVRIIREETPLGTGGGILNAIEGASDPFVLLNGDVISGVDMDQMLSLHRQHGGCGTMSLYEVEDPSPYGVAALDESGRIVRFVEKPKASEAPSRWINAGAGIWSRSVVDAIPGGREVSFEKEVLGGLLSRGVYGFPFRSFWEDAGTPARLLNAQRLLFDHPRQGRFLPRAHLPGAQVVPPVASGPDCSAAGAQVGRYATLGAHVRVGEGARVEDSVLLDGAVIGPRARVARAILGPGYEVPGGAELVDVCLANAGPTS
jgi:mannose-1-phosphate guanylyltransferase